MSQNELPTDLGGGGAGGHVPGQQRRRVHEQRTPDATVAAQADDAADARPEAALLELPRVPLRPPDEGLPLQRLGLDLPTFDFWGLLQADAGELRQRLSTAGNAG